MGVRLAHRREYIIERSCLGHNGHATDVLRPKRLVLQQFPQQDIAGFRASEERRLHGYGWVSKEAGVVHIPIEDAMRLTLERGLPARPEDPANPAATPGMMARNA